jgi:hypothetical protein
LKVKERLERSPHNEVLGRLRILLSPANSVPLLDRAEAEATSYAPDDFTSVTPQGNEEMDYAPDTLFV